MVVILPYCIKAKRCEHNALGYWSVLALCLTKVRSSRARCPATALMKLGMKHQAMELYKVYINHDPGMTLTFFTARST